MCTFKFHFSFLLELHATIQNIIQSVTNIYMFYFNGLELSCLLMTQYFVYVYNNFKRHDLLSNFSAEGRRQS